MCVRSLAALVADGEDEPAPEGADAVALWMRVQHVCRDAIARAEDVLGVHDATALDDDTALFGYGVCSCMAAGLSNQLASGMRTAARL